MQWDVKIAFSEWRRINMEKWQRLRFQPNLPLGKDGQRVTACKEHVEFSKNAAKEGMVLLKNENRKRT